MACDKPILTGLPPAICDPIVIVPPEVKIPPPIVLPPIDCWCPIIEVKSTEISIGGASVTEPKFELTIENTSDNCCEPRIEIDTEIEIPCLPLGMDVNVTSNAGRPSGNVTRIAEGGNCNFTIDINVPPSTDVPEVSIELEPCGCGDDRAWTAVPNEGSAGQVTWKLYIPRHAEL